MRCFLVLLFVLVLQNLSAQQKLPVIGANSKNVKILDGLNYKPDFWVIFPETKPDETVQNFEQFQLKQGYSPSTLPNTFKNHVFPANNLVPSILTCKAAYWSGRACIKRLNKVAKFR